jgi:hypothetical protein
MRLEEGGPTGSNDNLPPRQLVLVPTRHKLDRLGNSERFFVLGLRLKQYLGGLCASEHDEVFPVGIRLETTRECRGPTFRSGVERSGRSEESGSIASILQHESGSLSQYQKILSARLLGEDRLTGFELGLAPSPPWAFAAATDSLIRPGW